MTICAPPELKRNYETVSALVSAAKAVRIGPFKLD